MIRSDFVHGGPLLETYCFVLLCACLCTRGHTYCFSGKDSVDSTWYFLEGFFFFFKLPLLWLKEFKNWLHLPDMNSLFLVNYCDKMVLLPFYIKWSLGSILTWTLCYLLTVLKPRHQGTRLFMLWMGFVLSKFTRS